MSGFSEAAVWEATEGRWSRIFGDFARDGVSVEWHDFSILRAMDWAKSFHPGSLEVCVNFSGGGVFQDDGRETSLEADMVAYYSTSGIRRARRLAGESHRFLTIEMTREWLSRALGAAAEVCALDLRSFLQSGRPARPMASRLTASVRRAAEEMVSPPVPERLQAVWFPAKIVEISAHVFAPPAEGFFCERQKILARERVAAVKALLSRDLENPPPLGEIAREVGCSPFYLSRIFSEETGTTITRWLRTARLELAAARLRSGKYNVTEAAMSVGYSSLSHFSKAFTAQFGHCPCVFPLKAGPPEQKAADN